MSTRGFFVTGTDTGVGKTTVSVGLVGRLTRAGHRVAVLKPMESGCGRGPEGLRAADAEALREAAGGTQTPEETCVYRLATPVAPAVAARLEGVTLDPSRIVDAMQTLLARDPEWLFVEGAGGLLVPATRDLLMADLAALLGQPLLVVGRDGLGTINHTVMTIEVARSRGLEVAGFVLSAIGSETPFAHESNADEITRLTGARYLGRMGWVHGSVSAADCAEALELP